MSTRAQRNDIFKAMFDYNVWGGKDSRSGTGSDKEATIEIVRNLTKLLKEHPIGSFLDIPCGDMNWMPAVLKRFPKMKYIGADIVPGIIEQMKAKHPELRFKVLDACEDELPKVDMIFCRDMLGHLDHNETRVALKNFKKSGAKWLMATTFPHRYIDGEIITGGWRPIRLENYGLKPVKLIGDDEEIGKFMGLYDLEKWNGKNN